MKFDFIQVEVTRKCNASCIMCPNRIFDRKIDMSYELYKELSKYFRYTNIVHLQGWGEPLLHRNFLEMIETAKKRCKVSFTTNGMLLDRFVEDIVSLNVDTVAVSLAGASKYVHESIRKNTVFKKIIDNIKNLIKEKNKTGADTEVVLTFLMTKKNIHQLPLIIELSAKTGIDTVIATNLDYIFDKRTDSLKTFLCTYKNRNFKSYNNNNKTLKTLYKKYNLYVKKAKILAYKNKIRFKHPALSLEEVVVCDAHPITSFVVSAEGNIYPCAYLNLPFKKIPRVFCGEYIEIEKPYFGNISNFKKSWESNEYSSFRKIFKNRLYKYRRVVEDAIIYPLTDWNSKISNILKMHPLPDICRTCYKAYGI